jgi:hypothetical protein
MISDSLFLMAALDLNNPTWAGICPRCMHQAKIDRSKHHMASVFAPLLLADQTIRACFASPTNIHSDKNLALLCLCCVRIRTGLIINYPTSFALLD